MTTDKEGEADGGCKLSPALRGASKPGVGDAGVSPAVVRLAGQAGAECGTNHEPPPRGWCPQPCKEPCASLGAIQSPLGGGPTQHL